MMRPQFGLFDILHSGLFAFLLLGEVRKLPQYQGRAGKPSPAEEVLRKQLLVSGLSPEEKMRLFGELSKLYPKRVITDTMSVIKGETNALIGAKFGLSGRPPKEVKSSFFGPPAIMLFLKVFKVVCSRPHYALRGGETHDETNF
jgi:hypothetical protein